jgi:hypothetical protein
MALWPTTRRHDQIDLLRCRRESARCTLVLNGPLKDLESSTLQEMLRLVFAGLLDSRNNGGASGSGRDGMVSILGAPGRW